MAYRREDFYYFSLGSSQTSLVFLIVYTQRWFIDHISPRFLIVSTQRNISYCRIGVHNILQ